MGLGMGRVVGQEALQMGQTLSHGPLLYQGIGAMEPPGGIEGFQPLGLAEASHRLIQPTILAMGDAEVGQKGGIRLARSIRRESGDGGEAARR